jgi:hypothetical protein
MSNLKAYFGVAVIVVVLFVLYKLAPPFYANYNFQDFLENEAKFSTYSSKTEDDIRNEVFKKVQELDIPVTKDQIKVQRSNGVALSVDYTVHVDLPFYPVDLEFHPSSRNKNFM